MEYYPHENQSHQKTFQKESGLGISSHDFGHFLACCGGISSGQLGLVRGYKEFFSLWKNYSMIFSYSDQETYMFVDGNFLF